MKAGNKMKITRSNLIPDCLLLAFIIGLILVLPFAPVWAQVIYVASWLVGTAIWVLRG